MEITGKWISRTESTGLACWKQTKRKGFWWIFCIPTMSNRDLWGGRKDARRERVNMDMFVFKFISKVNIVIKSLEFKFLIQYFTMKNIFWRAEGKYQVWILQGPMGLVDKWGASCQLWMSGRFIYKIALCGPWTVVL